MPDASSCSLEVSPLRTRMDPIPALTAISMSVYRRSPTMAVVEGSTPMWDAAIRSMDALGFPMTTADVWHICSNILMKGPMSMS
jgi:hypothetical protein